jgi:hypothetical protein
LVSSSRFWSPEIHSASAIVPEHEKSSIAYHKEIYVVLCDPPSFLMVYSIVCHLWKKSKMKKFLPLPLQPVFLNQSSSFNFIFGNFYPSILDSKFFVTITNLEIDAKENS